MENWNSGEHKVLADGSPYFHIDGKVNKGVYVTYSGGRVVPCENFRWTPQTVPDLSLTFGNIVELAGDIYAVVDPPITMQIDYTPNPTFVGSNVIVNKSPEFSKEKERFINAFEVLDKANSSELHKVMQLMNSEESGMAPYFKTNTPMASYYNCQGYDYDVNLNKATGGGKDFIPKTIEEANLIFFQGRYMQLAQVNFDHFCENDHAYRAYIAGHTLAMETAATATSDADLTKAYAYEAFACHYLTDHFASGHMRNPRWGLHYGLGVKEWFTAAGDYCSRLMHDEDNRVGIWVASNACYYSQSKPEFRNVWRMYGDIYINIEDNLNNVLWCQKTMQISIDEVYTSFLQRKPVESQVWLLLPCVDVTKPIPKLDSSGNVIGQENHLAIHCNDVWCSDNTIVGYYSEINNPPMFITSINPDWKYKFLYKRSQPPLYSSILTPLTAALEFQTFTDSFFPGITHNGGSESTQYPCVKLNPLDPHPTHMPTDEPEPYPPGPEPDTTKTDQIARRWFIVTIVLMILVLVSLALLLIYAIAKL